MRKLKIQTQMTLDGYLAGPEGQQDWINSEWGSDIGGFVGELCQGVDTILLGRVLAEGFIPFWAANPEMDGAEFFNSTPKSVVSNSLEASPWAGTEILSGDFVKAVTELKSREGGEVIAYGGGRLVAGLLQAGLVDELNIFINPTAIGSGMPLFGAGPEYLRFESIAVRAFNCGVTALQLRPLPSN